VELARLPERVRPRQKRERTVVRPHREDLVHRRHVRRQVRVREDDALGRARRAARVDVARDVARGGLGDRRLFPGVEELLVRRRPLAIRARLVRDEHDVLEALHLADERLRLVEDGARGGKENLRLAVGEDKLPVLLELRLVHGHERAAKRVRRVGRDGPLGAVVRDDGDAVPRLHAERGQPAAQLVHVAPELRVSGEAPGAVGLGPEQLARGELREALGEDVDEGIELRVARHGGGG